MQKYNKAWTGLVVAGAASYLATYLTPELIQQSGENVGQLITTAIIAALTAVIVWAVPNKE